MPGDGLTSLASLAASLAVFLIVMALGLALNFAALRTRRHHIVERLGQPEQRQRPYSSNGSARNSALHWIDMDILR